MGKWRNTFAEPCFNHWIFTFHNSCKPSNCRYFANYFYKKMMFLSSQSNSQIIISPRRRPSLTIHDHHSQEGPNLALRRSSKLLPLLKPWYKGRGSVGPHFGHCLGFHSKWEIIRKKKAGDMSTGICDSLENLWSKPLNSWLNWNLVKLVFEKEKLNKRETLRKILWARTRSNIKLNLRPV